MNGSRNDGAITGRRDEDPFAELVDLLDDSMVRNGQRGLQAPVGRDDMLAQRRPIFGAEEHAHVEAALLELAEPLTPRNAKPAETAAFAPERFEETAHQPHLSSTSLDDFDRLIASEMAAYRHHGWPEDGQELPVDYDDVPYAYGEQELDDQHRFAAQNAEHDIPAAAPAYAQPTAAARSLKRSAPVGNRRRATFFAGGVAAVALVGVFGVWAGGDVLGSVAGGEPVLIRADTDPVKIAPADPGGRVIPNQNKAVYQRETRNGVAPAPSQEMLISAAEEPLDIDFEEDPSNLPGVMVGAPEWPEADDGVQMAQAEPAPSILQPHRVRTFDVRPDGTLVPREDPVDVQASAGPSGAPVDAPSSEPQVQAETIVAPAVTPQAVESDVDAQVSTASVQPSGEPAAPEPVAIPADAYFVQISSQPSQALAEESRTTLSSRYASAIGGRDLQIQAADIPDRGTYYRVRVVTASREEANSVCANLQSAGGSCLVTR